MRDTPTATKTLSALDRLGLSMAVDDFGTGYSSLAYLKKLPVSVLKIDRSFVSDMGADMESAVIVQSTISLAHNLGLSVVAEGVEDEEVLGMLAEMGCDLAQGFFFSRPIPAPECAEWIRERTAEQPS
jgi:EAL domain-containing protein (putative c-di-GMP-specific phosphodiesterase class I)